MKDFFQRGRIDLNEEKLSHAYIVAGPPETALEKARQLAGRMLCSAGQGRPCGVCRDCVKLERGAHPDFITVQRQTDAAGKPRREIYVEQVRDIVDSAHILPNEAAKKVYVIQDADYMNASAQNALLKLLEEPPEFVALLLLCENAGALLETVRSRCVTVRVTGPGAREDDPAAQESARRYFECAARRDGLALLRLCNELGELTPQQAAAFADCALSRCADMLARRRDALGLDTAALLHISRLLLRAREYLKSNVGVKHVFGLLSVRTIGTDP